MSESILLQMESRAKRHLDGMTVNRDAMARDVLALCNAIRSAKESLQRQAEKNKTKAAYSADSLNDIFRHLWR